MADSDAAAPRRDRPTHAQLARPQTFVKLVELTALRDQYADLLQTHRRARRRVQVKRAGRRADALTRYRAHILAGLADTLPTTLTPVAGAESAPPTVALSLYCQGETATFTVQTDQLPERLQTRAAATTVSVSDTALSSPGAAHSVDAPAVLGYFEECVESPNRYLTRPFAQAGPEPVPVGWESCGDYVEIGSTVRAEPQPDAVVGADIVHPDWTGEYVLDRGQTLPLVDGGSLRVIDRWTTYEARNGDGTPVCYYEVFDADGATHSLTRTELVAEYRLGVGMPGGPGVGDALLEACGIDADSVAPLGATAPAGSVGVDVASPEVRIVDRWLDDGNLVYGVVPVESERPHTKTEHTTTVPHPVWATATAAETS